MPLLTSEARHRGAAARAADAFDAYSDLLPIVRQARGEGTTMAQIADQLNKLGHATRTRKAGSAVQVHRMLERAGERRPG